MENKKFIEKGFWTKKDVLIIRDALTKGPGKQLYNLFAKTIPKRMVAAGMLTELRAIGSGHASRSLTHLHTPGETPFAWWIGSIPGAFVKWGFAPEGNLRNQFTRYLFIKNINGLYHTMVMGHILKWYLKKRGPDWIETKVVKNLFSFVKEVWDDEKSEPEWQNLIECLGDAYMAIAQNWPEICKKY